MLAKPTKSGHSLLRKGFEGGAAGAQNGDHRGMGENLRIVQMLENHVLQNHVCISKLRKPRVLDT